MDAFEELGGMGQFEKGAADQLVAVWNSEFNTARRDHHAEGRIERGQWSRTKGDP
jgi:hypothetical protein